MKAYNLLKALLEATDKASTIASIIRKEKPLVELLIQEKKSIEKNNTFIPDFKTLADVLIQETVRHDLCKEIPGFLSSIHGEESNMFTNAVGESIMVEVRPTEKDTTDLLRVVLDGNEEASHLLASAVHCCGKSPIIPVQELDVDVSVDECAIWIDPIDGTGQYIKGKHGEEDKDGLVADGLQCVAVLVGVYLKSSGVPVMGVVVQPFSQFDAETQSWSSQTIWGVHYQSLNVTSFSQSVSTPPRDRLRIILSQSEEDKVKECLSLQCDLVFASGAGYKLLSTVLGQTDAYVLSHRSIYRWDCCAVHSVLCAIGGGIISYRHALQFYNQSKEPLSEEDLLKLQVSYIKSAGAISSRRNSTSGDEESLPGIIAYRCVKDVNAILKCLSTNNGNGL